jgi:hypothetical protein
VLLQDPLAVLLQVVLERAPELLVQDGRERDEARGELRGRGASQAKKERGVRERRTAAAAAAAAAAAFH